MYDMPLDIRPCAGISMCPLWPCEYNLCMTLKKTNFRCDPPPPVTWCQHLTRHCWCMKNEVAWPGGGQIVGPHHHQWLHHTTRLSAYMHRGKTACGRLLIICSQAPLLVLFQEDFHLFQRLGDELHFVWGQRGGSVGRDVPGHCVHSHVHALGCLPRGAAPSRVRSDPLLPVRFHDTVARDALFIVRVLWSTPPAVSPSGLCHGACRRRLTWACQSSSHNDGDASAR